MEWVDGGLRAAGIHRGGVGPQTVVEAYEKRLRVVLSSTKARFSLWDSEADCELTFIGLVRVLSAREDVLERKALLFPQSFRIWSQLILTTFLGGAGPIQLSREEIPPRDCPRRLLCSLLMFWVMLEAKYLSKHIRRTLCDVVMFLLYRPVGA
ncbi:hypothetical protein BS47DRAFT_819934 [Hydnum rufescens UP504]|uniref:Uncharacterized protein n=1 Tax=Hydnum rufescens UP504 TaxID=1448309 RepID=A0A9P6DV63_9AGAM|nr:hypothetical protein BS47DRAFT_819934 [Hydnum rufescens UP504]